MKAILLILIVTLLTDNLYAQKKGYKEIQIGATLDSIKALHKYKILPDTTQKNGWLIIGDSLRVFLMDVDHLGVTVDNNHVIKRITLYSKQIVFDDYKDWLWNLKYFINVVNSDVGKLNSNDLSRPSDKDMYFAWSFVDTKTALFLNVPMVDTFATNFKSNYVFAWVEDENNIDDLKF